jgi:hypothetical protein
MKTTTCPWATSNPSAGWVAQIVLPVVGLALQTSFVDAIPNPSVLRDPEAHGAVTPLATHAAGIFPALELSATTGTSATPPVQFPATRHTSMSPKMTRPLPFGTNVGISELGRNK